MTDGLAARRRTYRFGLIAESLAALYLCLKGYRILARRYRTTSGEIDLVARRGRTIAFVEVKARQTPEAALSSLTPRMQARIERAALQFSASRRDYAGFDLRFDLIVVCPPFFIRHLDNAWRPAS